MYIQVAATRYFKAEDGTELDHTYTFSGEHDQLARFVGAMSTAPIPPDLPDFCGPWRVMTDAEARDYESRQEDKSETE